VIVAPVADNFKRNAKSVLTSRDLCYSVVANAAARGPEPAVLLPPCIGRFTDAKLAADLRDPDPALGLLQGKHNLLR
jgi:hypothetical protein